MQFSDNSNQIVSVFGVLRKKSKVLILVMILSFGLGWLVYTLMPKYYECTFSFLTVNSNSYDPYYILNGNKFEGSVFGSKDEITKASTIISDRNFKKEIVIKADLLNHYKLSNKDIDSEDIALKRLESNMRLVLNKEEGLFTIRVLDENKEVCSDIAQMVLSNLELRLSEDVKEKNAKILELFSSNIDLKKRIIDSLNNKLQYLRTDLGILDSKTQSDYLVKNLLYKNKNKGDGADVAKFIKGIEEVKMLEVILEEQTIQYARDENIYLNLMNSSDSDLSPIMVTQKMFLSDKDSKPGKVVVISMSIFLSLICTIIILLMKEFWAGQSNVSS